MNRHLIAILTASTIALGTAGGVSAQDMQLEDSAAEGLAALGVEAPDGMMVTSKQAAQIENVLSSSDDNQEKKARIERILAGPMDQGSVVDSAMLMDSVGTELAELGVDASGIDSLSVMQLAEIENVAASTDDNQEKKARIERIMAGEMEGDGMGPDASMLMDSVSENLAALGVTDVDVGSLSVMQLGEIENVAASTDDDVEKRARIENIAAQ